MDALLFHVNERSEHDADITADSGSELSYLNTCTNSRINPTEITLMAATNARQLVVAVKVTSEPMVKVMETWLEGAPFSRLRLMNIYPHMMSVFIAVVAIFEKNNGSVEIAAVTNGSDGTADVGGVETVVSVIMAMAATPSSTHVLIPWDARLEFELWAFFQEPECCWSSLILYLFSGKTEFVMCAAAFRVDKNMPIDTMFLPNVLSDEAYIEQQVRYRPFKCGFMMFLAARRTMGDPVVAIQWSCTFGRARRYTAVPFHRRYFKAGLDLQVQRAVWTACLFFQRKGPFYLPEELIVLVLWYAVDVFENKNAAWNTATDTVARLCF